MNEVTIWDALQSGLKMKFGIDNQNAVAGIMGYFYAKSGMKADYGIDRKPFDPMQPPLHNWLMKDFVQDGEAVGLAGWVRWTDKQGIWNMAIKNGTHLWDEEMQIGYFLEDISRECYKALRDELEAADISQEAVASMARHYLFDDPYWKRSREASVRKHIWPDEKSYDAVLAAEKYYLNNSYHMSGIAVKRNVGHEGLFRTVKINLDRAKLRRRPSVFSKTMFRAKLNDIYEVAATSKDGKWHCVMHKGEHVWVHDRCVV